MGIPGSGKLTDVKRGGEAKIKSKRKLIIRLTTEEGQ